MTDKQRLLHSLFDRPGKQLLNLKFFRGAAEEISEDRFCSEVNKVLFEIDNGITDSSETFFDHSLKTVDVREVVERIG